MVVKLRYLSELINTKKILLLIIFLTSLLIIPILINAVDPTGPDDINVTSNETRTFSNTGRIINISGGYIANMNITATAKNIRWKAFVGNVIGTFTLDDQSGATIYDWTFTTTTGRMYATRNSTYVTWTNINCSNITHLGNENIALSHTNPDDNITKTFNATLKNGQTVSGSHSQFYVGGRSILANSCPTLNTYIGNNSQDTDFEEISLYDGHNMVYATILENDLAGYDSGTYDFQMIVPENGSTGWSGATAYYLYVEIGS